MWGPVRKVYILKKSTYFGVYKACAWNVGLSVFHKYAFLSIFSKNRLKVLSIKQTKAVLPALSVLPLMNLKRVAGWQCCGVDFAGDSAEEATIIETLPVFDLSARKSCVI